MKQYNLFGVILVMLGLMGSHPVGAQTPDSLDRYLETAAKNNPGLNADFLAYKASLEKVPQAGAWPDPQLDIGFFLKPMDIVGGRQIADFTLMQMFPWFGTKKAAQTEATHMAQMAYEKFRETRDNLYLEVYTQWYLLSTLAEQLNNNRENLQLLKQTRYSQGIIAIQWFFFKLHCSCPFAGNKKQQLITYQWWYGRHGFDGRIHHFIRYHLFLDVRYGQCRKQYVFRHGQRCSGHVRRTSGATGDGRN